jgi:hypothetical protein
VGTAFAFGRFDGDLLATSLHVEFFEVFQEGFFCEAFTHQQGGFALQALRLSNRAASHQN